MAKDLWRSPQRNLPAAPRKKKWCPLEGCGRHLYNESKEVGVEQTRNIQGLIDFIKKFLKLVAFGHLFIYVNQSFAPSPDQEVGTLYECFGSDGKLVLHYCKSQAWGWSTEKKLLLPHLSSQSKQLWKKLILVTRDLCMWFIQRVSTVNRVYT